MFLLAIPAVLAAVSVSWGLGGAGRSPGWFRGVTAAGRGKGGGSGKRAGASQDRGKSIAPHSLRLIMDLGGAGKQGGWFSGIRAGNNLEPVPGFSKFQVFIQLVLNGTCGILRIDRTIRIHVRRCS